MKWTLILFTFLLVAVIHNCYAEQVDDDAKELAKYENAIIDGEEKDMALVNPEDEEEMAKMLNNKAVRKSC